jgi:hypothetical protein
MEKSKEFEMRFNDFETWSDMGRTESHLTKRYNNFKELFTLGVNECDSEKAKEELGKIESKVTSLVNTITGHELSMVNREEKGNHYNRGAQYEDFRADISAAHDKINLIYLDELKPAILSIIEE